MANDGRAMMENSMVSRPMRYILSREAFVTTTGLVLVDVDGKLKSHFKHWHRKNPHNMKIWGD
jgi:hypothetical protein